MPVASATRRPTKGGSAEAQLSAAPTSAVWDCVGKSVDSAAEQAHHAQGGKAAATAAAGEAAKAEAAAATEAAAALSLTG